MEIEFENTLEAVKIAAQNTDQKNPAEVLDDILEIMTGSRN